MDAERRKSLEATTRWDPAQAERRIFDAWMASRAFDPPPEGTPEENFSVAIPPPNVTGALHMGHALNGTVQDALTRMRRMQGRNALWILGTDHAGIATQAVVEKELRAAGESRHELGREAFVARVWEWREKYGSQIIEQYKRLGASCDYERERFTLDDDYVRAVYRVFVSLYEKGYIYRDNYIVNWDPGSRSAISDLEVVNREVTDTLYSIDYPLEGSDEVLTVATVRPETMLADTAVAVNPDDGRYAALVGREAVLPLVGRRLPIIADEHVDPEFGTGALKITPGHDPNDFEIGRAHGLEEIVVIGEDGRLSAAAGERFEGMSAEEAREAVVAALAEEGSLRESEPYTHSVPFSERSGERVEPLISLQWFCRMDELAPPAIEAVERDEVRIVPDNYKRVYLDWMRRIHPWCISRQLWWGHRLPVWYGPGGEEVVAESEDQAREAARERGIDPEALRQETDVLDTWFSSALWPFATLGWPEDTPHLRAFYPTSFLTTAREIIFLWVARMVMMGIEFAGEIPFRDVYVHPVVQAPDGRRMSKSLGTGIDPLDEIDVHGADALRFGLLAMASTQDVRFSEDRVQQGRDLANKMWNASRLILLNADAKPEPRTERIEDRWILTQLDAAVRRVTDSIDEYDFSHAVLAFYEFFWSELCDWYLEIVKPRLYDGDEDAAANLLFVLDQVLRLAHPVMPFVTEEIWGYLPDQDDLLVVSEFPTPSSALVDTEAALAVQVGIEAVRQVRRWRDLVGVPAGAVLEARIAEGEPEFVARLARLSVSDSADEPLTTIGPIQILPSPEIDAAEAETRIEAERSRLRSEIERGERKLANAGFVDKAPPEVVADEREKLEGYRRELDALTWSAEEAEAYLASLEPLGMQFGLERIRKLVSVLGMPQHRFASIHVVGTNGKSSVTQMTAALLEAHGMSAGAYLSPHDVRWAERIQIRGAEIAPPAFAAAVERVAAAVPAVERTLDEGDRVTQFEADTAAAFVALAAAGVEAGVIEAGLGGRLDATNVLPSQVTALTSIGLEHTQWLGDTEVEIAGEKLAVLRDHTTLVLGPVSEEVEALARGMAAERSSKLVPVRDLAPQVELASPAPYLRRDFAVALAAAEALLGSLDPERALEVAAALDLRGRVETVDADPPLILDAAHNPDGARALAEALPAAAAGRPVIACIAVLADKDAAGMVQALAPAVAGIVATEIPRDRLATAGRPGAEAFAVSALAAAARGAGLGWVGEEPDPVAALALARDRARAGGGVVLVTGSHYLLRYAEN